MRPKGPSESDAEIWDAMYKELEVYYKEHGHSNVPSTLKNKLSRWVAHQRESRRNEEVRMTEEIITRLDKLDFCWSKRRPVVAAKSQRTKGQRMGDERWREMYEKLKAYNKKHGHCKVPIESNAKDPDQSVLGLWVTNQRRIRDRMPQSRKDLLDELDFLWLADNWDTMYEQLVKFRQENRHTEVPRRGNASLAEWCRKQRAKMRQNKLPPERRGRMEEIGFNYELQSGKNERIWNAKLQRLKEYKRKHGNCLVPSKNASNHVEDAELSIWVSQQRMGHKRGTIPNHRIQKLEEVGFVWSIVERGSQIPTEKHELAWEKSYEKLREFHEVHGHFTVPKVLENGKINPFNSWISTQRKYYAQGQLKEDRRLKLEAIDFIWNQGVEHHSQRKWDAAFRDLIKFREEKGQTCVRKDDGMELWRWTKKMIWKRKRSTLSLEREQRLESIGFWDPPPAGYRECGENHEKSEEEDEDFSSSEEDDDRKPTAAKRRQATSPSEEEEEDEELRSAKDDDDSKPTAKRRRAASTSEEEDEEFWSSKNDDGSKPMAKRRRATSASEEGDEELRSAKGDDDSKPTAKRRRATSTSEEEDEEFWSAKGDDDNKPTAKRRRATSTSEKGGEELLSRKNDDDRKPTAKRRRATSTSEGEDEDFWLAKDDDNCKPAAASEEYEEEARISRSPFARYSTGTMVKKFFEGYGWFLGEITAIDEKYCCYVRYEDGDEENYLLDELGDLDNIVANVARGHPRK